MEKMEKFGIITQTVLAFILKGIAIWISVSPKDDFEKKLVLPDFKLQSIQFVSDSSVIV